MIVYDNYVYADIVKSMTHFYYYKRPRVVVGLSPEAYGRWSWTVFVIEGRGPWTNYYQYDGSRWGLGRAIRAAEQAGAIVEANVIKDMLDRLAEK